MLHAEIKGVKVPKLGFGTWRLQADTCLGMVGYALSLGYRHIDTAQAYGNEAEVGRAVAESGVPRDEIFLTTKVWYESLEPDALRRSAEESLRKLRTDYVDLLLVHWPNEAVPLEETLGAMAELRKAGKTRHVGVSNFTVRLLREAELEDGVELFCNQVEYHPFLSQKPILDEARRRDMLVTAYCPVARGAVLTDPVLTEIGKRYGKSPAQVALRWLIEQDKVAAIPGTSSETHCRANFEIFDFALDDEDRRRIDALPKDRRVVNPAWAPVWDKG